MKAWWFSNPDCKLQYDDKRTAEVGLTHKVTGTPVLCEYGLHASVRALDAISYAPYTHGLVAWRVELSGTVVCGKDKAAATDRTYLRRANADSVLRKFARLCALDVVHLWDCPPCVLRYLRTGDEGLRASARAEAGAAARAEARDAAWYAAGAAARAEAWDAAWYAPRDAAWYAAGAAARAEAWDAAWYAAWDALSEKQNKRLHRMLLAATRGG